MAPPAHDLELICDFFVPGKPQGKPVAKAANAGKHARMYSPTECVVLIATIANFAHLGSKRLNADPYDGPVLVRIRSCVEAVLKPAWKREAQMVGIMLPTGKPDIDNLQKALFDGITRAGIWRDDKQVVRVDPLKEFSDVPGTRVEVFGYANCVPINATRQATEEALARHLRRHRCDPE